MKGTALITGASGGIGKELAELFAQDGYHLVLVARSGEILQQLAAELSAQYKIQAEVIVKDLEDPSTAFEIYEEVREKGIHIDFLINNAGFGVYGEFVNTALQAELNMIDLNIKTLTALTKLFLPGMIRSRRGGILNVASTAAFQPGPLMAVYYATKAYVLSFTEALANELKGTGITVTALCPGPTNTGFSDRANLEQSKLFQMGSMNAREVAEIGYNGFMQGKTIVIPGMKNRLLSFSVRFLPRKTVTQIVRRIQALKPAAAMQSKNFTGN
ncbi:SDR family oxidoreductase [Brevibacillus sp. SYP-B805]|uniref:SDR family NAD(P)-dependent oxidoreductase n=1 Tax=Brevibacillus sp. SYP-B805 TaxID=1578199 RepID=UPI0013EB0853|nr:SDR family oxidoreductase [Brevibacillus sp. SYP-B805]NGQ93601.1 SDR family oxidoreductase [Brevibacillus sp. SYP-B805]